MNEIQTPDWAKHAVFYQIFPDRFAKSNKLVKPHNLQPWDSPPTVEGYKGGDLLGVVEHLDRLPRQKERVPSGDEFGLHPSVTFVVALLPRLHIALGVTEELVGNELVTTHVGRADP